MRLMIGFNRLMLGAWLLIAPAINWAETAALDPTVPERVTWQKTPIALALNVGKERRVDFPGPVKVGVPAMLQAALRVQSVAGTLYLLAHQAFEPTRLMVRTFEGGDVYLLDLSASDKDGSSQPIQVLNPETGKSERLAGEREEASSMPAHGYVALTRFAAQQLYAPARLLRDLPGVVRVPVRREPVLLLRGGQVIAEPLVAWRAGDLYVTAVKLTNQSEHAVTLDPRTLRGRWLTAAFQHHRLLPRGDEADTTAAYLIAARPLAASL
jgi:integrating conjugative element protein (TIGR03749 family)